MTIVFVFLFFLAVSLFFGIVLSLAAKYLAVKKDPRIEAIIDILPGANCGACGYPGCSGYAEAIVHEGAKLNLCTPGGAAVIKEISLCMGVEASDSNTTPLVAYIHCKGSDDKASNKYLYEGLQDCQAQVALYGGAKSCQYGCLGNGSCIKVCPADAIFKTGNGIVEVNKNKCIGCGLCVDACPTSVIRMIPSTAEYVVACNSREKGAVTRKQCKVGCIACRLCEKKSPEGGFIIQDNLAIIDYNATGERDLALASCNPKCILKIK